ncbi:MAG: KUP/HAK/KT family potassium transporter, partial [Bacteroidales bacterium]|nr:KUP/HAK/KT family potassium transporter [Bacteroidales bacterium]
LQPRIITALSPVYCVELLKHYPGALAVPGLIFLSTTGAELLYSNLGQIGVKKLRISWLVVKLILVINYLGQGAWLLSQETVQPGINPFFALMPEWFLIPGILIALAASVVASQALISGSYTLLGEAISLNFWPRIRVYYPTQHKGQIYIPMLNWFLWVACSLFVITYREPSNMAAAYGLSVIIPMIISTLMLSYYMYYNEIINHRLVLLFLMIFIVAEGTFLISILSRIWKGGWITIILSALFFALMYGWFFGRKIRNRYITFADLYKYIDLFKDLVHDESIPRFATNLVYIIHANRVDQVESKVIYSIFHRQPKRADTYWLLHIDRVEEPDTFEYHVTHIIPGILIRVDFRIGFKIEQKINLYFREVLEDLVASGEIKLNSSYESLRKHDFQGDFKFILIERIIPRDFNLSNWEKITMLLNNIAKYFSLNDIKALKLDSTNTILEQVPITADQPVQQRIKRI